MPASVVWLYGSPIKVGGAVKQTWQTDRERGHCGACNAGVPGGRDIFGMDYRLGVPVCRTCAERWERYCQYHFGGLPTAGRFFCIGCKLIQPLENLCKPDADGRKRWRCLPCRQEQVRQADKRRKDLLRGTSLRPC